MATLAHHFVEGGWGMYPIVACTVVLAGIALERAWFFGRRAVSPDALVHELGWALRRGDARRAIAIAMESRGPMARVAQAAVLQWSLPMPAIENAIEEQLRAELAPYQRRLPAITATGAIATLCGLLGTVTGLSGGSLHVPADAASRATMLARGISEAMNCLAFALFVALCAIACAVVLRRAADRVAEELRASAASLRVVLAEHRPRPRWHGPRPPAARATYRDRAQGGL